MEGRATDIGPYSRPHTLAKLDQRTKPARLMAETRARLIAHCGGAPNAVQMAMIDRIAMLTLHTALFDARALEAGTLSERDSRQYLAYSNALGRSLRVLGIKGAAATPPSLAEHLVRRAAEKAASEQPEVAA